MRPAFLRLLPSFRAAAHQIPQDRERVQKHVRAAVKKYGPSLGPLYSERQPYVWEGELRTLVRASSADLLKSLETEAEEESAGGSESSPRREGERVPTGITRFKDE